MGNVCAGTGAPLRAAERVCLGMGAGLERVLRFGFASLTTLCKLANQD